MARVWFDIRVDVDEITRSPALFSGPGTPTASDLEYGWWQPLNVASLTKWLVFGLI